MALSRPHKLKTYYRLYFYTLVSLTDVKRREDYEKVRIACIHLIFTSVRGCGWIAIGNYFMRYARAHEGRGNMSYIQEAFKEGRVGALEQALIIAEMHREYGQDIDYVITSLKELVKKERDEIQDRTQRTTPNGEI